jgi:hypothetical protein
MYVAWVPDEIDTGITVAARAWFYGRTFREVAAARAEVAAGDLAAARARLERFLAEHDDVQPARLETHAVIDAGVLLSDVLTEMGRPGRGAELLAPLIERIPLEYKLHWAQGRAFAADGDHAAAAGPLREAFKLTLHHTGVIEDLLSSLGELNASRDVAWVADEYQRALRRSAPHATLMVGFPRSDLERFGLRAAGIPVQHGRFVRHLERFDLVRGSGQRLEFPPEMFADWTFPGELVLHVRMENVYEGFTVDSMEVIRRDGRAESSAPKVAYLHRDGSGVGAYAEIFTGIQGGEVERVALQYSCDTPSLSERARRVIARARRNLESREGG